MEIEITSTNPAVKAVIMGTAPRPARLAAAKGLLPLSQGDLLEILVNLAVNEDAELAETARATIDAQDPGELRSAVQSETAPSVLSFLARKKDLPREVHEVVITNLSTPDAALVDLAKNTSESALLELIAVNQQRLIRVPELIEAIIANSARTPEAERRARETRREFFEKERGAQQIANELRAQGKEAAAEFIERAEFAGGIGDGGEGGGDGEISLADAVLLAEYIEVPDVDVDDSWLSMETLEEIYEETPEQRQAIVNKILGELKSEEGVDPNEFITMVRRILLMGVKDRVRYAMKGDREVRNILIRDSNRIVSEAVIKNPKITDQEVEKIAAMRTVSSDILRQIGTSRQWLRSYSIIHNLARNPRTPMPIIMSIIPRLMPKDLKSLGANRNVPDAVRQQAARLSAIRNQ
jgi:hypothetical protein